jgi:hypothetical protein
MAGGMRLLESMQTGGAYLLSDKSITTNQICDCQWCCAYLACVRLAALVLLLPLLPIQLPTLLLLSW